MPLDEEMTPCTVCGQPVLWGSRHHQCGTLVLNVMREAEKYRQASTRDRDEARAALEAAVTAALRAAGVKEDGHA